MLKERPVEFVEILSAEDKTELSVCLREQDQKSYDDESLEIARRRSEEMKNSEVQGIPFDDVIARVKASKKNA